MPYFVIFIVAASIALLLIASCQRVRRVRRRLNSQLAEQATILRDDKHRQELMFTANPCPMWVFDCETLRFTAVNEAAIRNYGHSREEFLNMTLMDIRLEKDRPALLERVKQPHTGYLDLGIWRHRRKDGSTLLVDIKTFEFQANRRRQRLVVASDMTERCRMEEALRESEASLKQLVDNAPFGISQSYVEENRAKSINPAFRKILGGYSLEEVLRLNIAEQIYANAKDRDKLMEVLRRNRRVEGWETTFRRQDGSLVPVRITGLLSGGTGTSEVCSCYVEDMTQQSTLEQQVRQVQKLEAVGRLAGGMAHDFNNILVVIKLSTEMMLAKTTPDHAFSKPLLQISNAADRAAALTRQMLAFGRQQIMQPRVINLNNVVKETISMLRRVIGEDIRLVTTLADTIENSRLDPDQVGQVILNLAVNARDAMPDGGTLHIETAMVDLDEAYTREHPPVQPGRYVMLAVNDTGTGIDKSILPRIFDPFFTTKELGKGTGLGLSIVYGIVKQSGGYVWVYSEPGQGTTFKLYFPVTTESPERPVLRSDGLGQPAGQTLLVVEDDEIIRGNVCECLRQLGYRVLQAGSGVAALELCAELNGKVDLVLTDLVMAGKSGHELASDLAERYPRIRVLFMSGYSEDTAARRDILQRGSPFLQKPFSVGDLAKAVQLTLAMQPVWN